VKATVAEVLLGGGQCESKDKLQGQQHDHFQHSCAQFPGRSFAAGGQYPTAIVPIRPKEPLPFPV